jgi:hypothetical protein
MESRFELASGRNRTAFECVGHFPCDDRAGLGCPNWGLIRNAAASSLDASASRPGIRRNTIARL